MKYIKFQGREFLAVLLLIVAVPFSGIASGERLSLSGLKNQIDDVEADVNANTSAIANKQNRVTGVCPPGEAMVAINIDGSTVCDVTAPATDSVGTDEIIDGSITRDDLAPDTHYLAIPAEAFVDAQGGPVVTSFGQGGAYRTTPGSGVMVAAVYLPHGAVVTELAVWVLDEAAGDLNIKLHRRPYAARNFIPLVNLDSSGNTPAVVELNSGVLNIPVNNDTNNYLLRAFSSSWPGNFDLRINAARVTYTH